MSRESVYDVIISGAGPVGLFLACELALAQCSVLVLEKAENPESPLKKLPFGIRGLSTPTIEALDRRGLLPELEISKRMKDPFGKSTQTRRQSGHFAGIPFHEDSIERARWTHRLPSSLETHLISEMEELETVLTRRATALGVEIKRGLAVTGSHETGDGVRVDSGEASFHGQWLVGCDGSRSVVRKAGGFEFAGTEPEFTGYSTRLDLLDPEKLPPGRNLTDRGLYFQSQPGYLVLQEFDGGAFHHAKKPITLEHVQDVLRRVSGIDVTIKALHVATTWTDRARQATRYRKGRLLLAGDAAHIHAPLGGQGLNLGIGDAMNLGWKLAATIRRQAPESLLDSYELERHPIGVRILDWSRAQVAAMRPDPHARALHAILRELMNTRDGATYMAGKVWGVSTHYHKEDDALLVGYSVPNFAFEDGTRMGDLMHDGQGILLDFDGHTALRNAAEAYRGRLKYISGRAKEQLGLSALLIRPDGYISWSSAGEPDQASLQKALAAWFA